jgi:membrane fusion protein (multidrug efflux system)
MISSGYRAALVVAFAGMLAACDADTPQGPARPAPRPVLVETVIAREEPLRERVESVGTLNANESVTVTAKVTEQVSAVHFEGGELVKPGQVLVELVSAEQVALQAEARASLREAQLQLERLLTLGREIATAAEIDAARARVDASEARLQAVGSRLDDRTIRAPFAGVIGFRQISVGALLNPGTVIAELNDIDTMKLDFYLPEAYLSRVGPGDLVTGRSVAFPDREFEGAVSRIGSRVDPVTRTFQVRARLDNSDRTLRPGMLMNASVSLDEGQAIVLPERALVQTGDRSAVFRVDNQSIAERVPVELGRREAGSVIILGGLAPGDRVVVTGQMSLRPGAQVREASDSPRAATAAPGADRPSA